MCAGPAAGRIIVVIGLLAGFAAVGVGLSLTFSAPDAARDFRMLNSKCVITNVFHEAKTRTTHNTATKKSDKNCYDTYTYVFAYCADGNTCSPSSAPSAASITTQPRATYYPSWSTTAVEVQAYHEWWVSFPPPAAFANTGWETELLVSNADWKYRGFGACSSGGKKTVATHNAGDWVTCYQPTQASIHAEYECGNTACIKVVDPAYDLLLYSLQVSEALYFGIGLLAFFFLFFLCLLKQAGWSIRDFFCCVDKEGE